MDTRKALLEAARHFAIQARDCDEMAQTAAYPGPYIVRAAEYGAAARLAFAEAEKIPTAEPAVTSDEPGSPTRN